MSRANPFGDLDDFAAEPSAKPVPATAIDQISQTSGFPSRKAQSAPASATERPSPPRQPRRHTTGRNRQINIKATEETIAELYRIADDLNLPLGAVLEQALAALDEKRAISGGEHHG